MMHEAPLPRHDPALHEGCWFCSTPMCEDCTDVPTPVWEELRDAFVLVCPSCAGDTPGDPEDLDATRPADLDACPRCDGTGGIPVGPGLVPWELEYDACPDCDGTGTRPEACCDSAERGWHDADCDEYDGAPTHQWEVTTPADVHLTDDTWSVA